VTRITSIDAYHEIKRLGLLSERRWETYDLLTTCGPVTAKEMMEAGKLAGITSHIRLYSLEKRLPELRSMGVVREVGTRVCSVTSQTAIVWEVTEHLPGKLPTTKRVKSEGADLAALQADNEQLRKMLRILNARYKKLLAKIYPEGTSEQDDRTNNHGPTEVRGFQPHPIQEASNLE